MEWLSNFGMREWLISCGIVLVAIVLFDGFRRMRRERKGEIKMALRMGGGFPDTSESEAEYSAELPNGGARVIDRAKGDERAERGMERREPTLEANPPVFKQQSGAIHAQTNAEAEQFHEALAEFTAEESAENTADEVPFTEQQIIVIHAKARAEQGFNGSDLLQILLACDMRYGDRDILHRHERAAGDGNLQFSVANMVEPGTFNLEDISSFHTPGVTFFMTLPGADEPEQAFDCMLETANCLVKNLDADLLDDNHQPLTPQMINQYRGRVKQFSGTAAEIV